MQFTLHRVLQLPPTALGQDLNHGLTVNLPIMHTAQRPTAPTSTATEAKHAFDSVADAGARARSVAVPGLREQTLAALRHCADEHPQWTEPVRRFARETL